MEELARILAFQITMDLFGDDMIRARNQARENRGPSSVLAVLRSHAKDHVERAKQLYDGTPSQRLHQDPLYAICLQLCDPRPHPRRLSTSCPFWEPRDAQMIRAGVVPQYSLIFAPRNRMPMSWSRLSSSTCPKKSSDDEGCWRMQSQHVRY